MASNLVLLPYSYFSDPSRSRALSGGQIFIGEVDKDPETFPIDAFYIEEDGTEVPADQPLIIGPGGMIVYNGKVVQIGANDNYSMRVRDKHNAQVYNVPNNFATGGATKEFVIDTVSDEVERANLAYDLHDTLAGAKSRTDLAVGVSIRIEDRADVIFDVVSGEISDDVSIFDHDTLSLQIKAREREVIQAAGYMFDYSNPTISELNFLMSCGKRVLFKPGSATWPAVTVNLTGNTIWQAVTNGAYSATCTTTGYAVDTNGNTGTCGIIGLNINGNFLTENLVRFANCNIVYCEYNHVEKITKTNDATKNYRGAYIFLNINELIQGGNSCEFIEQNTPVGFAHGQHQSFSYNNVGLIRWNGSANNAKTVDKLWHCDGTSKGNTGHHVGEAVNDNAMYILGTPQSITATIDCDGYQEGIVFNPSGESEVNVPYCLLKSGSSKVMTLRSGSGLNVGVLKSFGSRTGISDDGHAGSTSVTIDYCYMQDITEERALSIVNSGLTINSTLKTVNVASTNFNEIARVSGTSNFVCGSFIDTGTGASTCLRLNEFTTGKSTIQSLQTNKTTKVAYQSGIDFGGKSFINRINGFLIQGGAPSTLIVTGGSVTVSQNSHRIDTEGGASLDDLDTINGAPSIDTVITLQTISNVRDVIIKHNTGNIHLPDGADIRLNSTNDTIQLKWNGTYWSKPI